MGFEAEYEAGFAGEQVKSGNCDVLGSERDLDVTGAGRCEDERKAAAHGVVAGWETDFVRRRQASLC